MSEIRIVEIPLQDRGLNIKWRESIF